MPMRDPFGLSKKLQSLRPLWTALSPRRRRQLLVLQGLSLLAALGEVANLGALLPFLRLLAKPEEGLRALGPLAAPLRALPSQHLLLSLGLGFMAIVVASSLLRVATIRLQLRLGALIAADLGEQVFTAVLGRSYTWHLQHNSSSTLGFLTKDVDQVYGSVQGLLLVAVNLAIVVLLGGSLIALAPGVMLVVALLLAGFYLLVFRFTRATLRSDGERLTRNYQASLQVAQEGLGGIRDVLLDQTQAFFINLYCRSNLSYRLAFAAINVKAQTPRYLIEGFAVLLIVAVSLTMALSGQGIERQLPLLGTMALGAYRLLQPLQQCFGALGNLQANQASLRRLQPFLAPAPPQPKSPEATLQRPLTTQPQTGGPLLQLQNLSFRYSPEGPWVLRDLDLGLAAGERLAFVGSTGSGKSTCSDLILGLLAPSQGQVLVQGADLHATEGLAAAWRARVTHVPQQIYLSDASFAANIAFGVSPEQIDQQRVRRAAEQAHIAELITTSPEGYDTLVGERGVRLSGGQRQRIGIARALYKQAQLLVLDEATSALDNRTEAEVMAAIEALDRRLTVILIAHRLSTVRHCDRIVLLEQGRIAAIGTYQDLEASHAGFRALSKQPQPFPA
jgi:ABC-type multidrug transport system fused ATPase/permease subunit